MTWYIAFAAIGLILAAFALAVLCGYQQAREMAGSVEGGAGTGSTWNNDNPRETST